MNTISNILGVVLVVSLIAAFWIVLIVWLKEMRH